MSIFPSWPLHNVVCLSALVLAIGFAGEVEAGIDTSIYGDSHQKVESVSVAQAQIVMFRGNDGGKQAAHVYIDGELQSALMPGGYTVFCTPAGEHSVESYIGDAPLYTGKRNPQSYAKLAGGQTYVLEAPVGIGQKTPIVHTGKQAERSLQGMRRQIHVLSRASAVVPCQTETRLSLRSDVLFAFGKGSYQDLTAEGRSQLSQVVQEIRQDLNKVQGVEIVGHADPIGTAAANQRLSLQRAESIRRVLLEAGIQSDQLTATGRGSLEPVVQCNSGSRSAQIACNAPNRRVELVIRGAQASL
ncbi:OmpA family protein [Pseudomonas sp. PDM18]|uniref:OmpA family protein n=1 Tax=Pseudomonas sp. PDM18 TaxID=2769253 RepID=UPI001781CB61|nr:OmpA family protein [Pseudomonas sp. PDM18]MBD9680839.1 OmpA family protein [Pseudomonas sp. PDM18]